MQFPVEICEAVIDQARDHQQSLHNLSLTCRTLLPRARYQLFSLIHIRTIQQMESSGDFLDAHPWVLPLVHTIRLSYVVSEDECRQNTRLLDVVPVPLLTRLPNLCAWEMGPVYEGRSKDPVLSFHRSALSLYRRGSSRIQSLDLSSIQFDRLSDFTGLVSAFTSIHTLTCRDIQVRFPQREESSLSSCVGGTGMLARPLQVTTLKMAGYFDIRVAEYMMFHSGAMLSSLHLDLMDFADRFEKSMSWLSRLSSLTLLLVISPNDIRRNSERIRSVTRVLKSVERTYLTDVQVGFIGSWIANIGSLLSGPDAPLEDCKSLEEALVTFRNPRIYIQDAGFRRVAGLGRAEFWSRAIEGAFPTLHKRELLKFMRSETFSSSYDSPGHESYVTSLVTSHDSRWIVTASDDDTIIIWDPASGAVLHEWSACQHGVYALALSPDSRRLVSAGRHTAVVVWAIGDGRRTQKVAVLERHKHKVKTCSWSADGTLIASASSGDNMVCVWDSHTFQQRDLFLDHNTPKDLRFSPDTCYLAWISGNECCIWRPLGGEEPKRLSPHPDRNEVQTDRFSFDPESRHIATAHGSADPDACVVRVWDVATGATVAVLRGHLRDVVDISFSPDGRFLLSASLDGSARIWDAKSWKQTALLDGADDTPWTIAKACFSPDGKHVAIGLSSNRAGKVRLWGPGHGLCVAVREGLCPVTHLAFTPCGKFLASGDVLGIVRITCLSKFTEH